MANASEIRAAYRRYGPALIRKCRRLLQNDHDPEDIVQELFVSLLQGGKGSLELPYLYRAVTNRCLNLVRQGDNRKRLLEEHNSALRGLVRTSCDEQVIGMDLLFKLIDQIDGKHSELLVYRYYDDMSQEEIASLIGTSRKTVGKRLKKLEDEIKRLGQTKVGGVA